VYYLGQMPFGGVGGSGYGRFAGEEGLGILWNTESASRDRVWFMSTSIPPATDCPIKNVRKAWEFGVGIVCLATSVEWLCWRRRGAFGRLSKPVGIWDKSHSCKVDDFDINLDSLVYRVCNIGAYRVTAFTGPKKLVEYHQHGSQTVSRPHRLHLTGGRHQESSVIHRW
jgi:hypothetical protein